MLWCCLCGDRSGIKGGRADRSTQSASETEVSKVLPYQRLASQPGLRHAAFLSPCPRNHRQFTPTAAGEIAMPRWSDRIWTAAEEAEVEGEPADRADGAAAS